MADGKCDMCGIDIYPTDTRCIKCECESLHQKTHPKNCLYCSFCGKSQHEVSLLIAGPAIFICDECVVECVKVLTKNLKTSPDQKDKQ